MAAEIGINVLGFIAKMLGIRIFGKITDPNRPVKNFLKILFLTLIIEAPALFLLGLIRKLSILANVTSIGVVMIITTFIVYWLISWFVLGLIGAPKDRIILASLAVAIIAVVQMLFIINLNISLSNMGLFSLFGP